MLEIIYKDVVDTDVSFLLKHYKDVGHIHSSFQKEIPFLEPYKLLTYLSLQFSDALILDAGTYEGVSATCLSRNSSNKVITYDIVPKDFEAVFNPRIQHSPLKKHYRNLRYKNLDINKEKDKVILSSSLISIDLNHTGEDEKKFTDTLLRLDYKGYILADDTKIADIQEWISSLPWKKYDLTEIGHRDGTILLDCGNNGVLIK